MVARRTALYQIIIHLPMWLDLAWLVSATCKKIKKNALDRIGEPLCVLQDGKPEENQLVLTGPGVPLNRYGGSVKDPMTLLSAKEGTWSGSPAWRGRWRLTCDPDSLSGGCQSPLGLCLGMGVSGRGSAQARMLGAPSCKNTIYNTKSKPKKTYIMHNNMEDAKSLSGKTI